MKANYLQAIVWIAILLVVAIVATNLPDTTLLFNV